MMYVRVSHVANDGLGPVVSTRFGAGSVDRENMNHQVFRLDLWLPVEPRR